MIEKIIYQYIASITRLKNYTSNTGCIQAQISGLRVFEFKHGRLLKSVSIIG